MKTKLNYFLLAILMSMVGIRATAHNFTARNSDNVTIYYSWKNNHTEVYVSWKGTSYSAYSNEYTGNVVIPASVTYENTTYPVTGIDEKAFYECSLLTSVTIPSSVTYIGESAFDDCSSLENIIIPNSVMSIGEWAFSGTAWYNNQTDGLIYAGLVAYKYKGTMPSNTSITLQNGTLGIANSAFEGCSSKLISVTIPNSVKIVGERAFYGCTNLTGVNIPNSVTNIGSSAFYGCTNLTSVNIPNSVTNISSSAFNNTAWYNNQPDGLIYAGLIAYKYKGTMPSNTSITIQEGTLGITDRTFSGCSGLTSVDIPNSVTTIGDYAFYGCSNLTSVDIPNSVTTIGDYAFYNCSNLTSVSVGMETPVTISYSAFSNRTNSLLYVPSGCKAAYEVADYWKEFKEIEEVEKKNINSSDIFIDPISVVEYNGSALTPTVTVRDGSTILTNGTDYTVSYSNNINIGTATVTITGKGYYIGSRTVNFIIRIPLITNIVLNETDVTLYLGDFLNSTTLTSTISPSISATVGVTWSSSNPSVASVNQSGVVTAVSTGTATITCTANDDSGVTATCQITVKELSTLQIGQGTSKISHAPFHSTNTNNEIFLRYKAQEIGNAGKIHAISFFQNGTNSTGTPINMTLEIWMGQIDYEDEFYTSTVQSGNEKLQKMTRVYQGQIQLQKINGNCQVDIVLDTPYEYDANSNLNIFIATIFPYTYSDIKFYSTSYSPTYHVKYRGINNEAVTPAMTWNTSSQRPNIKLWFDNIVKSINNSDISISIPSVTYNGSAQTPNVTVKDGSTTLTNGTHYTVSYSNNTNAGTATATITGKGNYTGTKSANFTINAKSASNLTINSIAAVTYNGSAQSPAVTVKDGTTTLTNGTHYTVSYSNNTNVGTATATITGMGNYTGTKSANFTINAKSASNLTINSISAVTYNGSAQTPAVTVKDGTTTLTSGTHYTVSYSNNVNVGTATATITGIGNYTGTKSANFTISAKSASNLTINSIAAVTYNGSAQTPTVTVKDGSTTLTSGTHYTVSYSNNTNAGTATATITGKGNYTGTKSANFTINPKSASSLTINSISAVTYTGSAQTPTVTVKDGSTTLTSGTHYTVSYSNNTNAGTATATITGIGNYTGTKSANFTINAGEQTVSLEQLPVLTYGNGSYELPRRTTQGVVIYWYSGDSNIAGIQQGDPDSEVPRLRNSAILINGAGTTTITAQAASTSNCNAFSKVYTLTINKAASAVTTAPTAKMLTYTGAAQQLVNAGVASGGTMQYSLNGTSYSTSIPTGTNAGSYTVYYKVVGDANHTNTNAATVNVTINAKNASNLTINAIAAVTYNGSAQTPTVTVKDGTTTLTSGTDYTVSYSNNTNVGMATATITGRGNYTGTNIANFTIEKAPLTITAKSYTINQLDDFPVYEVEFAGFVNNEDESVLSTQPTITCTATDSETAGEYTITPSGAEAQNYDIAYVNGTLTISAVENVTITIGSLGMGTYCSKFDLDFSGVSGIRAYIASGFKPSTGMAFIMRVEEVPANTGIMVKGTPGTYTIPVKETDMYYKNMFKGTLVSMTVPAIEDGCQNYVLRSGDYGVKFYVSHGSSTLGANKAYLQIPTSIMGAREYINFEEDNVTGIVGPEYMTQEDHGELYNLNGQRITNPKRGIYIKNGKKIMIRK